MTDEFDKIDKQNEIDGFLDKFDRISNVFDKSMNRMEQHGNELEKEASPKDNDKPEGTPELSSELRNKTRMERLSDSRPQNFFKAQTQNEEPMVTHNKKKKKYHINKKKLIKFVSLAFLGILLILGGIVISIIATTEPIEPDNIYERLSENSVLYDDEGNIIDSLLTSDGLRTNVSYTDLPENLVDAFVAIEDKTFWEHNGFNVVRIIGAIKEGIVEGESISGTSTITQQLARNVYLAETKSDRDLTRKIKEAYYAVLLERHLSKKQILEAYLNTIFLGYNANGVQAASQAYFSKDIQELTLTECVALASLPQAPDRFALVKRYESEKVTPDDPNIIRKGETYTLVYNDAYVDRKNLVLSFMLDQGKITQAEYDETKAADLRAFINPSQDTTDEISAYFADYAIKQVIADLMEELNLKEDEARQMIYNNGLKIYSTMNSRMQKIAEEEFTNNSNFPKVAGLKKDGAGNIVGANGNILLYNYDSYFNEEGTFLLTPEEYQAADDGGIILTKGKRLNFYKVEVKGQTDYNVEFKDIYVVQDGVFYCIKGGVVNIPQQYKSRDDDGNLIISGQFFTDQPDFFEFIPEGIALKSNTYTLRQKVIQPQSAMVILDYSYGGIKAMVGGRNTEGRLLFNRATSPRQPGSAIKPMGVYGPALQSGLDKANAGIANTDAEGNSFGTLWTAASVIDDAPLTIQGKLWPKNWYSGYRGLHTLRESIEQSINVNAVKVFSDIGVQTSLSFLKKCGISTIVETGDVNDMNAAALALGGMSHGVSPLEMVAGYSSFANQGNYTEPVAYTKVTNKRGEIILEKTAEETRIMDPGVAFIVQDMLRTTVTNGIAGSAAIGSQPVAGKTGTTSDNYDAWFVGFTPQYAASVWIGNDVNVELSQGSVSAAKIWSKIMKRVHEGVAQGSFASAPGNVISVAIDTKSGRLPSELSALDPRGTVRNEYFIKGTEPTTTDNVHVAVEVCSDSNYLATPYCPNPSSRVFVKRPYAVDPSVADYSYEQPSYYCNLHNPNVVQYPIDPNVTLDPGFIWDGGSGNPDGGGIIPIEPGNGNHNGNDNGNGNQQDDGSKPPDWLDFLD
ncbi:MAG: transglycosylase domain-containing protein [Eubacteriales bacterium]|nr:transglycosylase domain-containing protein [Eubacteriales bacterium]